MPNEPRDNIPELDISEAEYRRKQELRAKRRQKRRMQRIIVLAAFALGLVLLIVCIVLLIRAILSPGADSPSVPVSSGSQSVTSQAPRPTANDPTAWNLVLVNMQNELPADFISDDDVTLIGSTPHYFDARAVDHLERMLEACNAVEGNNLQIIAAYRSEETQARRHSERVNEFRGQGLTDEEAEQQANRYEPPPNYAEHRTGLAVDFITAQHAYIGDSFEQTAEFAWLMENGADYGFILRYPADKENITGMAYQPYHFRYVGFDDARRIAPAGICLEEYLAAPDAAAPASTPASGSSSAP